jgi:uncharacterized protein (UPF0335 family)
MSDVAEKLKAQLIKGYAYGDGSVCVVSAHDLETFISEIERLRAELDLICADRDVWRKAYHAALEPKE